MVAMKGLTRVAYIGVVCIASTACNFNDDDDPPNTPPQFGAQRFTGVEDTAIDARIAATDPGDTLTFTVINSPQHGTLTLESGTGAFHYEPDPNYNGADAFVARATDSAQQLVDATIGLEIAAVNDPAALIDDVFSVLETDSLAVLSNDTDPEGHAFVLESVDTPWVGAASITADNTVALQLPPGFSGVTRFRYRVRESTGLTSEATALVFVGIDPFKVVYLGTEGIYVDDLLTTYRVGAAEDSWPEIASIAVSANGRALAYLKREATANTFSLLYVDLDAPDVARRVNPSVLQRFTGTVGYWISPDGRYVAYETLDSAPIGVRTSLLLFDAESTAAPTTLGSIVATQIGLFPQFNAASSHLYHVAETPDGGGYYAVYRTDLATGLATRVSGVGGLYDAFGGYGVAHNESQLVTLQRRRAVGVYLYSSLYLVDPNQPDTVTRLDPGFNESKIAAATISRDGSYVFLTITGAFHPFSVLSSRIVPTATPTGYQEIGTPEAWVAMQTAGLHPSHMRADSRALLFTTRWNTASINHFEVMHDNPSNLILVNAPTLASEVVTDGRYSLDGERIFYVRRYTQTDARALEVTRRGAFGTSTPLTLPADRVHAYQLDSGGHVALIVRNTTEPYLLVNADAPQVYLELDGPGTTVDGAIALVAR
jgi:hypothetical protein